LVEVRAEVVLLSLDSALATLTEVAVYRRCPYANRRWNRWSAQRDDVQVAILRVLDAERKES
jgi:hypothetical protein